MNAKKWLLVLLALVILTSIGMFGQTKRLRDIGRYRFIPIEAGTSTTEMMKVVGEKYADDIRRGFELAGCPDLYLPFIDRVRQSACTKRNWPSGAKCCG